MLGKETFFQIASVTDSLAGVVFNTLRKNEMTVMMLERADFKAARLIDAKCVDGR